MSELPSGWTIVPLQDVSEKVTDGTHKTPNYVASGIRFISIKNIRPYKPIDWNAYERYITREEHEELIKRCNPEKGDIVFPRIGTLGFAKIVDWDIEFSLFVGLGLVKPDRHLIEPKYLEHFLNSPFVAGYSEQKATGTGRMTLALAESKKLPVLLAPLAEQTRIAQKLDELLAQADTLKARIDAIPVLLKRFRQSVLAAAVSGQLTEEWRALTDVSAGENQSTEWLPTPLPMLGELARGKSKHRPRNDKRLFGDKYPFIQTGEVANSAGRIKTAKIFYSDFGLAQSRLFPKGTLCITIAANIADTATLDIEACFPDSVVGFVANKEKCCTQFVKYLIDVNKQNLEAFAPATAQKNINLKVLSELAFPIPPLAEQNEIVHRVEQLFAFADQLEAKVASAKSRIDHLTQSILAKAFRGDLMPQDPNDEPASLLLERIKAQRAAPKAKRGRKSA